MLRSTVTTIVLATALASGAAAQCFSSQVYFDSTWKDGSYTVNGETPQWFFPHWSNDYDVACIGGTSRVPAIWHNSCSIGCRRLEFIMKGRGADDDTIGFVLGFCDGDATDPDADYLAVLWNVAPDHGVLPGCAPAGTHPRGLRLVRVFGIPDPQELWSHVNLDLPCSDLSSGVEPIASALTRGDARWPTETDQHVAVEVRPNNLRVWVEGTLEFDVALDMTPYLMGCFGYFAQSQYADFWNLHVSPLEPVDALWENYGPGLAGCDGVPSLTMLNRPLVGTDGRIALGNSGSASRSAALLWGLEPEQLFLPFLGGDLLVAPPFMAVMPYDVPPGGLWFDCFIPDNSCAAGFELYLQLVQLDPCGPEGAALSRGLRIVTGDR